MTTAFQVEILLLTISTRYWKSLGLSILFIMETPKYFPKKGKVSLKAKYETKNMLCGRVNIFRLHYCVCLLAFKNYFIKLLSKTNF